MTADNQNTIKNIYIEFYSYLMGNQFLLLDTSESIPDCNSLIKNGKVGPKTPNANILKYKGYVWGLRSQQTKDSDKL